MILMTGYTNNQLIKKSFHFFGVAEVRLAWLFVSFWFMLQRYWVFVVVFVWQIMADATSFWISMGWTTAGSKITTKQILELSFVIRYSLFRTIFGSKIDSLYLILVAHSVAFLHYCQVFGNCRTNFRLYQRASHSCSCLNLHNQKCFQFCDK